MKNTSKKVITTQILILAALFAAIRTEEFFLSNNVVFELVGVVLGVLIATSGIYWMKRKT